AAHDHDVPCCLGRRNRRRRQAGGCGKFQEPAPGRHEPPYSFCAAIQVAMASIWESSKPLAMRPITLEGQAPLRYWRMVLAISAAGRPVICGITESATGLVAWQPLHELAPGGASAAHDGAPARP